MKLTVNKMAYSWIQVYWNDMKQIVICIICFIGGISAGWYFGYTRPALQAIHLTQEIQKETGMSLDEMARAVPDTLAAIKREDESMALISLKTIELLNRNKQDAAKKSLAYWVGVYYRMYRSNGDTNLLVRIEKAATQSPEIAAELAKKKQ